MIRFNKKTGCCTQCTDGVQPYTTRPGFTIMEAIIALVILVLSLTPLLITYSAGVRSTAVRGRLIERVTWAESLVHKIVCDPNKQKDGTTTHQLSKPSTTATIKIDRPSATSALINFRSIKFIRASLTWQEQGMQRSQELVTCVYKLDEQDEA